MRIQVRHLTQYRYSQSVQLDPHILRLRPRLDGSLDLNSFSLQIDPHPYQQAWILDHHGNSVLQLWFQDPTDHLTIETQLTVTTHRANPFDFLLPPWALKLPISDFSPILAPYQALTPFDTLMDPLPQNLWVNTQGDPLLFVNQLNQTLHDTCQYITREQGDPWPAAYTWAQRKGSCRDLAVLFVACCRAVGLPARFVSGYQVDPSQINEDQFSEWQDRDLHAWAEVYLPGGGWRGYDPTQGLAVAEQHIPLSASNTPSGAAPLSGRIQGNGSQIQLYSQAWAKVPRDP